MLKLCPRYVALFFLGKPEDNLNKNRRASAHQTTKTEEIIGRCAILIEEKQRSYHSFTQCAVRFKCTKRTTFCSCLFCFVCVCVSECKHTRIVGIYGWTTLMNEFILLAKLEPKTKKPFPVHITPMCWNSIEKSHLADTRHFLGNCAFDCFLYFVYIFPFTSQINTHTLSVFELEKIHWMEYPSLNELCIRLICHVCVCVCEWVPPPSTHNQCIGYNV